MNKYVEYKQRAKKRVNNFKIFFAYNNEQFQEGMKKFNLDIKETNKIIRIPLGGFILKTDKERYLNMSKKIREELLNLIKEDKTGENFIFDMFSYELNNHEYCYSYDETETLDALGFTQEDLESNQALSHGLNLAIQEQC